MKKIFQLMIALVLACAVVGLYSCTKPDDQENVDPKPDPENPDPENPDPENPDPENPDPENPDPEEPEEPGLLQFKTIDFNKADFATWVVWDNKVALDNGFSYVFWVCPFDLSGQQRIGNFADVADDGQTCINMLRFGESHNGGYDYAELEWWCGGSSRIKLYSAGFTANQWTQLALVCDGTNLQMYFNGELIDENAFSAPIKTEFGAIEFANSWGKSWRSIFKGSICQISVYDSALTAAELGGAKLNGLNAALKAKAKSWWPMQEGEGVVCKDEIGGRDIDFANTVRNDDDGNTVHYAFDASSLVEWTQNVVENE